MDVKQKMVLRLARHFQLEMETSEQIKAGVYRVKAKNGNTYCIKKMNYDTNEIAWMDQILKNMIRSGYDRVCWSDPFSTRPQLISVKKDTSRHIYILTPWISGRTPSASDHDDMYACAKELAAFHQAGRGVKAAACKVRDWLGAWPKLFAEYRHLIATYVDKAKKGQLPMPLTRILTAHGSEILRDANKAILILANSRYRELCQRAEIEKTYCHADSGPKNFVLSKAGPILIDFETLRLDLRIYDIYRMIRLANKSNHWDFSIAKTIMDGYQAVDKLLPEEFALMAAWLLFPHKVYRIVRKYDKRTAERQQELERSLQKELEARQHLPHFLRNLHEYSKRG